MSEGRCIDCAKYNMDTRICSYYSSLIDLDLAEEIAPCDGFERMKEEKDE